jgi:hypothetical protein
MKVSLCDLYAVCICNSSPLNFLMPEPVFMQLGTYVMAPEPIPVAYFINTSHQSLCLCVSLLSLVSKGSIKRIPPFIAKQRLGKHIPAAKYTRNNRKIVGCVWLCICLCVPLLLLGNNSVKASPRQRRIVVGVVLYVVRVVSKESRLVVFPRSSFSFDLTTLRIFDEEYDLWYSPFCNILQSPVTSSFLGPNNFLCTLLSNTLGLFCSPDVRASCGTHTRLTENSQNCEGPFSEITEPAPEELVLLLPRSMERMEGPVLYILMTWLWCSYRPYCSTCISFFEKSRNGNLIRNHTLLFRV